MRKLANKKQKAAATREVAGKAIADKEPTTKEATVEVEASTSQHKEEQE